MATEIRSGNTKVSTLKKEVENSISILTLGYINKRVERQLVDGAKFIAMISTPPYNKCKKVSKLKEIITEERKKLQVELKQADPYMVGHQFTIFENVKEVSPEEQLEILRHNEELKKEIHWLHKCLGICSNKDYFK